MVYLDKPRDPVDPEEWGANCGECPLRTEKASAVPARKVDRPRLVVLAEHPGKDEARTGKALCGASGIYLEQVANSFGVKDYQLYKTNVIACRPPEKLTPADYAKATACCQPRLLREIYSQPCKTILSLGSKAQQATVGKSSITGWLGTPYNPPQEAFLDYQHLSTFHPAFVLRSPQYRRVFCKHFHRALLLAEGRLPPWEWPKFTYGAGDEVLVALQRIWDRGEAVTMDVETVPATESQQKPHPQYDILTNVGFADSKDMVSVLWQDARQDVKDLVRRLLEDTKRVKRGQNFKYDKLSILFQAQIEIAEPTEDTLVQHFLVAPGVSHGLSMQAAIHTHAPHWKEEFGAGKDETGQGKFLRAGEEEKARYNAQDCVQTNNVALANWQDLAAYPRGPEIYQRFMALDRVVTKMETLGNAVSPEALEIHREKLATQKMRAQEELLAYAEKIKPGVLTSASKTHELKTLFFEHLGVKPTRWSEKTNEPSLDKETLSRVLTDPNKRVAQGARLLLRYRKYEKLLSTYVVGLLREFPSINEGTPVIYPSWRPGGARTGRWSCRCPNMQNIPKRKLIKNDEGELIEVLPNMRNIFVARPGKFLVAADYSQLELRVIAFLSGAKKLIEAYEDGLDVHTLNARLLFGVEEPQKAQRNLAKGFVYNCNYGGGPEAIHRALVKDFPNITIGAISQLQKRWFQVQPEIKRWQNREYKKAEKQGFVEERFSGIRYHFYDGRIEPTKVYNHPVQVCAARLLDLAVLGLDKELNWGEEMVWAQVHDELVLEGPDPVRLATLLEKHMVQTLEYRGRSMSFPIDFQVGTVWGELTGYDTLEEVKTHANS